MLARDGSQYEGCRQFQVSEATILTLFFYMGFFPQTIENVSADPSPCATQCPLSCCRPTTQMTPIRSNSYADAKLRFGLLKPPWSELFEVTLHVSDEYHEKSEEVARLVRVS